MGITSTVNLVGSIGLSMLKPPRSTYSFLDLSGVIAHPTVGSYIFTGQGIGQINISMNGEKTFHEIDIYGNVIIGKSPTGGGSLSISCQQTSNIYQWLSSTYLFIVNSTVQADWAKMGAILRSISGRERFTFKGLTFNNYPEMQYGSDGGMVTWKLLFADVEILAPNPTDAGAAIVNKVKSLVGI
jgi:hypothetical protein